MTTRSFPVLPTPGGSASTPVRVPLRLRMARNAGANRLDGGWWPQGRDLATELTDLVDHFPLDGGRVIAARISAADWDPVPGGVPGAVGAVGVALLGDDAHVIELTTADLTVLRVLVVPPGFSDGQGAEALLAAATAGNEHAAADLLAVVTESPDVDPADYWVDGGGSWWGNSRTAPSFREASGQADAQPGGSRQPTR